MEFVELALWQGPRRAFVPVEMAPRCSTPDRLFNSRFTNRVSFSHRLEGVALSRRRGGRAGRPVAVQLAAQRRNFGSTPRCQRQAFGPSALLRRGTGASIEARAAPTPRPGASALFALACAIRLESDRYCRPLRVGGSTMPSGLCVSGDDAKDCVSLLPTESSQSR